MKKRYIIAISMVLMMTMICLVACTPKVEVLTLPTEETLDGALRDGGYKLVFEDDFDTLDRTHWSVGYGEPMRRGGYYAEDAVMVQDGSLIIRTDYRENGEHGAGWYTGWVESASRGAGHIEKPEGYEGISKKYGYFEARCRAPKTYGIWSAFWFMPDSAKGAKGMSNEDVIGSGKDGVEIDVMESLHYSNRELRQTNQHVLHGDGYGENANTEASPLYDMVDMYDTFHTYGVMWTDSEYIFYVDGRETWRTKHQVGDKVHGVSEAYEYMLLTVEIAGSTRNGIVYPGQDFDADGNIIPHWAGNPNANDKSKAYDFVVDYVKVYQR